MNTIAIIYLTLSLIVKGEKKKKEEEDVNFYD